MRRIKKVRSFYSTRIVFVILVLSLGSQGCTGGESNTERARRNADPAGVSYLLDAQKAFESSYFASALILTDSASRYAPELADIYFLRGRAFNAMRQMDSARVAYEKTLQLDPEYPGVYYNLGNSAYVRGQPLEALTYYRKETGSALTAPYYVQLGRAYNDTGQPDSARWAIQQAIQVDSTNPTAHMWLGQILEDEGALDKAIEASKKGLALQPQNPNYSYVVGAQYLKNGDLEKAVTHLQAAARQLPSHYPAHYNLGQALMGLGLEDEGAFFLGRADTLLELQKDIEKWENLVNANSHEPLLWVNLGNALHLGGRTDEAIDAFTVAFSLQPQWLELQNNIANLLLIKGDTAEAIQRYTGILDIDSTQADVWLNLGTIHAMLGNYDLARSAWQTTLRLQPNHPEASSYMKELPQ